MTASHSARRDVAGSRALIAEGRLDAALAQLVDLAARDPGAIEAHVLIYEVAQLAGQPELALRHQRLGAELAPVQTSSATGTPEYTLLVPVVTGPFTANTPLELLFDPARVTIHRWYADVAPDAPLPAHDAVFTAAGESDAAQPALARLAARLARHDAPIINDPARIAGLTRTGVAATFAGSRLVDAPATTRLSRERYAADGVTPPHIVRPVGSHAGIGLAAIFNDDQRAAFLAEQHAAELSVAPFVDYRSADGYYRKYRIVFIGGVPYGTHLAISQHWMVHYYNAPMTEHQWMRDEEAAFLEDLNRVYHGPLRAALDEIGERLQLDYVGIDCAVGPDGRLLLFEADNAIIVHALDDPVMFAYKHRLMPRVFAAVDALVRRAIARA